MTFSPRARSVWVDPLAALSMTFSLMSLSSLSSSYWSVQSDPRLTRLTSQSLAALCSYSSRRRAAYSSSASSSSDRPSPSADELYPESGSGTSSPPGEGFSLPDPRTAANRSA